MEFTPIRRPKVVPSDPILQGKTLWLVGARDIRPGFLGSLDLVDSLSSSYLKTLKENARSPETPGLQDASGEAHRAIAGDASYE
jgi:hypothetical protein